MKTDIHLKNQVLAAFLDITGTVDNVLIEILCWELKKEGVPTPFVYFMWETHLWSVLSPFMYNVYTCLFEACLNPLCSEDLVVYISGKHVEAVKNNLRRLMTVWNWVDVRWLLRQIKRNRNSGFLEQIQVSPRHFDTFSIFNIQTRWTGIYKKHLTIFRSF
jgi:hypothetical protein